MVKSINDHLVIEFQPTDAANCYLDTTHAIIDAMGQSPNNYHLAELLRQMLPTYDQAKLMFKPDRVQAQVQDQAQAPAQVLVRELSVLE
jgi:hypothetical protein